MSAFARVPRRQLGALALMVAIVVIIAGALWWVFTSGTNTKITAYFDRTVAIYPGSKVKVLGIEVGSVDSVHPEGKDVKVVMSVDGDVDLPANVKAVQIEPSLVPDRYIQLAPAYDGGPKLGKTATIPLQDTRTPVEVDELYKSISQVSKALGPDGVNKNGALSQFIDVTAANLNGNGDKLGQTITELSKATQTLSDSRGDIFATVDNLQKFVSTLAAHDQQVREFNKQMVQFSDFLNGERSDLGKAVQQLSVALGDVARFVHDNKERLGTNVQGLADVTGTIAKNKQQLQETLSTLPLAIANLVDAYDPSTGTIQLRPNIPELQDPLGSACKLLDFGKLAPGDPKFDALSRQYAPLIQSCQAIAHQIQNGVKTPTLVLPFGILSGDNEQRNPVPGTVPGTPSPRLGAPSGNQGGGQ